MTIARREIVFEGVEAVYHCVSRCVRRAFLCGFDSYDGKSYEHRKEWIRDRLELLTGVFGIDILAYAVMSNHLHVVLRTRPDHVAAWTAEETARRWLAVFPNYWDFQDKPIEVRQKDIDRLAGNAERIKALKRRLGSISWFMRCLNENIARRANRETGLAGRFWSGRFFSRMLPDEAAVLACMAYVDLNPVRAGLAASPEESGFTSVFERIQSRRRGRSGWLRPIGDEDAGRRGALSLSLDEYLTLVDWTGRIVRSDKSGRIPDDLAPLLDRLDIRPNRWAQAISRFGGLFRRAARSPAAIRPGPRFAEKAAG